MRNEIYISVDIETAGPYPAQFSMLSIGACLVEDTGTHFYAELQPDHPEFLPEALKISGLKMASLRETGKCPVDAMTAFANWISQVVSPDMQPVFVALNAPFDWMFINDYFYRYLGYNPFGHSALDIKAFYMGFAGVSWSETSLRHIARFLRKDTNLVHNALQDAQDQAEIFQEILAQSHASSHGV